ncbi:hypothetical protein [Neptuniibacter marinus]|uniref:hypothetical protein n=1 Tax=Neptuniibacter marinus TaxID=1806670 RepID=UPI003B5B1E06
MQNDIQSKLHTLCIIESSIVATCKVESLFNTSVERRVSQSITDFPVANVFLSSLAE